MKGDINQCKEEVNITFRTPINLDNRVFKHQLFLLLFCDKVLAGIGMNEMKNQ